MTAGAAEEAHRILDANSYMVLATADPTGRPWASPVWFARRGLAEFVWVSRRGTRHSRNIAERAEVGIVVFDSTVPAGDGTAVYLDAVAHEVPGAELTAALATFADRSRAQGLRIWQESDVTGAAEFRLYRARTVAAFVLDDHDGRTPLEL